MSHKIGPQGHVRQRGGVRGDASRDDFRRSAMTAVMARRSLVATCIMAGIDAMGVRLSLYHIQKRVQVYSTQIMI
jgi:hypothetical protein